MQSDERYIKARKALLASSGLLLLSIFVGISQKPGSSGSILPFQLDNPGYIPHALALLVLYSLYNIVICWSHLASENQQIPVIRSHDYLIVVAIGSIALVVFAVKQLNMFAHLTNLVGSNDFTYLSKISLFVLTVAVIVTLTVYLINKYSKLATKRLSKEKRDFRTKLHLLLEASDWILDFNPRASSAKKKIGFRDDGQIVEGHNENESFWSISENMLEIYKADGDLQNRFQLVHGSEWLSTNDPDADAVRRGIKNQRIYPANQDTSEHD